MRAAKNRTALVLGGEPRVELLPPEVGVRAQAASLRRVATLGVIAAVVLVGGAYTLASLNNARAQVELTEAQERTSSLIAARQKYAEVSSATALADSIVAARALNASTEVLWSSLITEVSTKLPAGVSIESATMKARSPWESTLAPSGPLRQARVGTVSMVLASPTIVDATTVIRGLETIPGYADATPDALTGGGGSYRLTITFNVGDKALSGRFAERTEASK